VIPDPASRREAPERRAQAAAARTATVGRRSAASAARAPVVGVVAVVAQAKEPDQEHGKQADVQNAERDEEDPPLRGHPGADGNARRGACQSRFVGFGVVMTIAV
jgi:hypothetical protein